jgi:3D (Asp-Asp-Asp) domain-containing protein
VILIKNKRLLVALFTLFLIFKLSQAIDDSLKDTNTVEYNKKIREDIIPKTAKLSVNKSIIKVNIIMTFYTISYADTGKLDGISASGKHLPSLSRGGVQPIAAPKNIPFGTKIVIDGVGTTIVEDRGGAIKYTYINGTEYMKVDVFVPNATAKKISELGVVKTTGYIVVE